MLVTVNTDQTTSWDFPADRQLAAQGVHEAILFQTAPGPATSSTPVSCESVAGPDYAPSATGTMKLQPAALSGPPVKVLLGTDGTDEIPSGTTGAGTVHVASCAYYPTGSGTQVGNSGTVAGG